VQGLGYGFGQFFAFGVWCLAFWYGSRLVDEGHCDFGDFIKVCCSVLLLNHHFKALNAIVFSAMISGQVQATAPDYNKATASARRLYRIIMAQQEKEQHQVLKPKYPLQGHVCTRFVLTFDSNSGII
jgi:hypothetical protein